jgi:hypothetical protein
LGFKQLIQRNPISGHWERNDITDEGEHSATALRDRARATEEQLKEAIANDSSPGTGEGEKMTAEAQHPVLKSAVQRPRADRDRENAETNAKEDDRPELTPRKTKRQ